MSSLARSLKTVLLKELPSIPSRLKVQISLRVSEMTEAERRRDSLLPLARGFAQLKGHKEQVEQRQPPRCKQVQGRSFPRTARMQERCSRVPQGDAPGQVPQGEGKHHHSHLSCAYEAHLRWRAAEQGSVQPRECWTLSQTCQTGTSSTDA